MINKSRKLSFAIVLAYMLICTFSLFSSAHAVDENKNHQVLFISSYNYDWETVPEQLRGFSNTLDSDIYVEYMFMDTKHVTYQFAEQRLIDTIENNREKYLEFDSVVVADDHALDFIIRNKGTYFNDPAVVFISINDIDRAKVAAADPMVTGIIAKGYYYETLEMATQIYPDASKVVAITDDSKTAAGTRKQFENAFNRFGGLTLEYFNTTEHTQEEIKEYLRKLDQSSILFYLNFLNDSDGNEYTTNSSARFVYNNSSIPAFRTDYDNISSGLFGGKVLMADSMAEEAALIINDIQIGTQPSQIPMHFSEGVTFINDEVIEKFDVKIPASISAEAIHLNKQKNFLTKHYVTIILVSGSLSLILLIAMMISHNYSFKRRNVLIHELEQANDIKSDFLARMSHNMRTPLNSVIGLSNFGIDENRDPIDVEYFRQIRRSSNFLLSLLNDILDMQKIESDEIELQPEVVKTVDVLNCINTIIFTQAKENGIVLITNLNDLDGVEYDKVDVVRMQQILINLLDNAIKFTPNGGYVEWKARSSTDKYGKLCIEHKITDTGIGMSEEFQKEIYDPFFQGKTLKTGNQLGTGLGLPIVKNLLKIMGGSISVKSRPGKGSTFTVTFPHHKVTQAEIEEYNKLHKDETCRKNLYGKHVLICEDFDINAAIFEKILEKEGMVTTIAQNGQIAIDKAKESRFDVILMDVRMPLVDGITATTEIRKFDTKTPIIALSAHTYQEDIDRSIAAGMQEHLAKPVDTIQLLNTLCKYCK